MPADPSRIVLPPELLPVRRPLRLGPVEGARRGGRRAGRAAPATTSAPATASATVQVGRRARPRRPRRAVLAPRRLRGAARQRRHHRVLGRGHVRARSSGAASTSCSASSPPSSPAATAPRPHLDDPEVIESAARHASRAARPSATVDAYCWPQNETSTGVMLPVRRPDGVDAPTSSCSSTRRPAPAACAFDPTQFDVYYFAPQKCFAGDGGLWLARVLPRRASSASSASRPSDRWVPAEPRPRDRARALAARPDLQHAGARHAVPARRPDRLDARPRRARVGGGPVRPQRRDPLRLGRGERGRDAVRRQARRAQPRRRHDRLRRRRRRRGDRRRRCGPTASSTPSRTASSAATSSGSRCSRRSSPTTSPSSPARSTT